MSKTNVTTITPATSFVDSDSFLGIVGGKLVPISAENLKKGLIQNNDLYLNQIAFYIEPNVAQGTDTKINKGGSSYMFSTWEAQWKPCLMDKDGNYTQLSESDFHYTEDGVQCADLSTGEVMSDFAKCNFMILPPKTYGYLQTVSVSGASKVRFWLSLVPLPGGSEMEQATPDGLFKGSIDANGALRSLPNKVTADSKTIMQFFSAAQLFGKDFGLAGGLFRDIMYYRMNYKYGTRDSQNATASDGTAVWGVGLDGTESTSSTDKFAAQKDITTGKTMTLGKSDGKVAVTDAKGDTVHCVSCLGVENPWGQKWEMDGHRGCVGSVLYHWASNFMPQTTLSASTFTNVNHRELARATSNGQPGLQNIVTTEGNQFADIIPTNIGTTGISSGDYFYCDPNGQLVLWGGSSAVASYCGLRCAASDGAWSDSYSSLSARLDYHGVAKKVTTAQLKALSA